MDYCPWQFLVSLPGKIIIIIIIMALIILTFWDESTFVRVQLGKLLPAQRIPWSGQKTRRRWRWRRRWWWCEKCRRLRTFKTWSSARPLHRREERSRARRTRIDRFPCFRPCRPAIMMMMLGRRRKRRRTIIDRFPCSRPYQPATASIIYISIVWPV